jgi:hypothetical protein
MPDRQQALVVSQPARFEINQGSADNISFFVNVTFPVAGEYWVQTLVDSNLFEERGLVVPISSFLRRLRKPPTL